MTFLTKISRKLRKVSDNAACSVVIAAAGNSERMDGEDKLFLEICGKPVLAHSLTAFQSCEYINEIIIVTREEKINTVGDICRRYDIDKAVMIMSGGPTRLESVMNGVLAVSSKAPLIAIHDGARPCIDIPVIERAVKTAAVYHAAAPAVSAGSTMKRAKESIVIQTIEREDLYEIQTPQVFTSEIIKAALTNAIDKSLDVTDDCMAVEMIGGTVRLTSGSRRNIKITTNDDIIIAEAILGKSATEK